MLAPLFLAPLSPDPDEDNEDEEEAIDTSSFMMVVSNNFDLVGMDENDAPGNQKPKAQRFSRRVFSC